MIVEVGERSAVSITFGEDVILQDPGPQEFLNSLRVRSCDHGQEGAGATHEQNSTRVHHDVVESRRCGVRGVVIELERASSAVSGSIVLLSSGRRMPQNYRIAVTGFEKVVLRKPNRHDDPGFSTGSYAVGVSSSALGLCCNPHEDLLQLLDDLLEIGIQTFGKCLVSASHSSLLLGYRVFKYSRRSASDSLFSTPLQSRRTRICPAFSGAAPPFTT